MSNDVDREVTDTTKLVKGEVKEVVGAVTGDRRVEAKGRAEQQVADRRMPADHLSDEAVDRQESQVRQAHHDVPSAEANGPLGT